MKLDEPVGPRRPSSARRPPRVPIDVLAMSAGLELCALALASTPDGEPLSLVVAAALHSVAAVLWLTAGRLPGSRRTLAATLVMTLPVAGLILAVIALGTEPHAELAEPPPPSGDEPELPDPRHIQRVVAALPPCELLMTAALDERRATLAALVARGDNNAVSLLRWLVSTGGEMAVEAALALDELATEFESELARRRAELARRPSPVAAAGAAALITTALETGIVEPMMARALAVEARQLLALAYALTNDRRRPKSRSVVSRRGGVAHAHVNVRR